MAEPKMFTRQYQAGKETYLAFRYKDDGNKNYEYQVYQLVEGISVAKKLGISDTKPGRKSKLNTREMWDKVWEEVTPL